MKAMTGLLALLNKANTKRVFGTNAFRHKDGKRQRYPGRGRSAVRGGLADSRSWPCPIVESEVDIHCPDKAQAEGLLKTALLESLNKLSADQLVMLKLTLPEQADLYAELVKHPKVLKVVALSGGYSRQEGNDRLRKNHGMVASFSRALVEGLSAQQSDAQFDAMLDTAIQSIYEASIT
jgi:fructose-bisphosphate aldolase, class I